MSYFLREEMTKLQTLLKPFPYLTSPELIPKSPILFNHQGFNLISPGLLSICFFRLRIYILPKEEDSKESLTSSMCVSMVSLNIITTYTVVIYN